MNINRLTFIPIRLIRAIETLLSTDEILEEVRIRKNRNAYIIVSGKNYLLDIVINDYEILSIVENITKNSLYAYKDFIINGYIPFESGIRIGIIGTASVENNKLVGIYDINELAIRMPNYLEVDVNEVIDFARNKSLLIYAPPGVGKTTLLRSLIKHISCGRQAKRVALIDTRDELTFGLTNKEALISVLKGYPSKIGIEIAVRTMNSEIIICDEIGNENNSTTLIDIQGAGIPIIATCHGSNVKDILSHKGIRDLHKHHIFDYYIGLTRGNNLDFKYAITTWEGADAYL